MLVLVGQTFSRSAVLKGWPALTCSMSLGRPGTAGRTRAGGVPPYPISYFPSGRESVLGEQVLDLAGGDGAADPGVESLEVGAAGDVLAYVVGYLDAAGVQDRQHRLGLAPGLTLGFTLGLTFGVVAASEVTLVPMSRGGHETLQVGPDRRRQRREHKVSIQLRMIMIDNIQ